MLIVGEVMGHERTYTVVLLEEDSGNSTVVEEIDWGGLVDMVGGYWGLGGRGDGSGGQEELRRMW